MRITSHKLPIEKERWSIIPRENRYFELCQKNQIGDEYYYTFECTNESGKHLNESPNIIKFKNLMTSERKPILQKLLANSICRFTVFVYIAYSLICSFICNISVYVLCTVSLRNKDIYLIA
jgi:hypothetical protein